MDNTTRRTKFLDQGNLRNVQVVSAVAGMFSGTPDLLKVHTPPEYTAYTEADQRQLHAAERRRERKRQRNLRNLHNQTHKGCN